MTPVSLGEEAKMNAGSKNSLRTTLIATTAIISIGAVVPEFAVAQEKPQTAETVVVTGYRASLQSALRLKQKSDVMLDAIDAEDIADFPDANLAESLQRIPGISIDRDNGEGRSISVRGLGGDFTRVRINGLEALSTAGANDAGSTPNRSRSFDFNTFASELFSSLQVRKTASAETDEGSLGATVDLFTGKPFSYSASKPQFAINLQDSYNTNGQVHSPRATALFSKRFLDGKIGFLGSAAYSERNGENDQYRRGAASFDYVYRGSTWAGNEIPGRAGFSAPVGTTFGSIITNPDAIAALTGSDPAAYAKLYPDCAAFVTTGATATTPGCNNSLIKFPALGSIEQQDIEQKRLGLTGALQIQLDDRTRFTFDALYSNFENKSTIYQVSSVGLNRNNTNAAYNTANAATSVTNKRNFYPGLCVAQAATDLNHSVDCGQQLYGTTPVPGFTFSFNPFNLDPYEYYNNPLSKGYIASANGMAFRDALIGRPGTDLLDVNVANGNADMLKVRNVDWRSAADRGEYTTEFKQFSINLDRAFTDKLRGNFTAGFSESINFYRGTLVEFNYMDSPSTFTYDERNTNTMPIFDLGFNAADPTFWGIVKGFSGMRHFTRETENLYSSAKADFSYQLNDTFNLKFGAVTRTFEFSTNQFERQNDLLNPTEKEAGVTTASLGRVIQFGQGLDVPAGTTSSFFAPSLEAFDKVFGFTCNCVNKWGDFTITDKRNRTTTFGVTERSSGVYGQVNFNTELFTRGLTGNVGVRQVKTEIVSSGQTTIGAPITGTNEYTDTLPSMNASYNFRQNMYFRVGASKVMARPQLVQLSPAITGISIPNTGATTGATMNVGNPKLNPYRANAYDASFEWYFDKGALFSIAAFHKDIESYPQTVFYSARISELVDAGTINALLAQFNNGTTSGNNQVSYINNDYEIAARQFRDAPGGTLKGWEISFQQDLKFLPGYLKNLGVQFNATHIESELTYILEPGSATVPAIYGTGPWLNASPNALNFTIYYETNKINTRISVAKREGYYTTYPIAAGTCSPGLLANGAPCDGPLMNEFGGSEPTTNVDFSFRYSPTKKISLVLEALNLTNQPTQRWAYDTPVINQYGSTGTMVNFGVKYQW